MAMIPFEIQISNGIRFLFLLSIAQGLKNEPYFRDLLDTKIPDQITFCRHISKG